jgi:predicted lipoprotein
MTVTKGFGLSMVKMKFNKQFGKEFMKGVTRITVIEYSEASQQTCQSLHKELDAFSSLLKEADIGKEKDKSGKSLSETVVVILKKILNASYQAVVEKGLGGLKDVANDGIKALNDKADSLKDEAKGFLKNIF